MLDRNWLWITVVSCFVFGAPATAADPSTDLRTTVAAATVTLDDPDGDGGTSEFYRSMTLPLGPPGTMLRTEDIAAAQLPTEAARGIRMLYAASDGLRSGSTTMVSGQVLLPKAAMPVGGWPIVAWEHGTTGIADVCAPSWRGYTSRDRTYLNRWLSEGFAVVATDYQGLGTPGPHPYLLFRPEGYSVLDGLHAALAQYPGTLRDQIILVGQSQGSGAALGSAWLAPHYAPGLHIIGVIATGLVVEFAINPGAGHPPLPVNFSDPAQMDAAFAMLRVEGTDHSLHPGVDTRAAMTPAGIALSHVARTACLIDLFKKAKADNLSGKDLFATGLDLIEAAEPAAAQIPDGVITVPVFAGTGLADYEASLPGQYNAVAAMCDAGTTVAWHLYPGLTHNGTVNGSLVDSIPFIKMLTAGQPIGSTCGSIPIPGPVQPPTPNIPFNN